MSPPTTDQLIDRLVAEHRPVRPLRSPIRRAAWWILLATLIVAVVVASHGLRPDLGAQLARPVMLLEWLSAVLTGISAAVAVFHLSVSGRSPRWLLLPLPALCSWLGTLSVGCLADYFRQGPTALDLHVSWTCITAILATSLPLGLLLLVMVRHAGLVRPGPTAMVGGLAVAAFAAAGLSLFHPIDTAIMVLVWHLGTVVLVACASWAFAEHLFAWIGPRRA